MKKKSMGDKYSGNVRRLAVDELPQAGERLILSKEAAHHASVLRLHTGSQLELFTGDGKKALARIVSIADKKVVCEIENCVIVAPTARRVVLIQALPKGAKLDGIVRACTELGVRAIHLAFSERSVPQPDARRAEEKCRRLARIAKEASALAGSTDWPEIGSPKPLLQVAAQAPRSARRVVFWESSRQKIELALLDSHGPVLESNQEVWIVVGPEGGLSESEIAALRGFGYRDATLGASVLRVETAAPLAVGLILYLLGAFNREQATE